MSAATTERLCGRCGKSGLTGRNRVHDECLSSAGAAGPVLTSTEPPTWFDDTVDRKRYDECWQVEAMCGAVDYTCEVVGTLHGCADAECRYYRLAEDQTPSGPTHTSREWAGVTIPPSPYEANWPEVRIPGEAKLGLEAPEVVRAPRSRILTIARCRKLEHVVGPEAVAAAKERLRLSSEARTSDAADARADAYLSALRDCFR